MFGMYESVGLTRLRFTPNIRDMRFIRALLSILLIGAAAGCQNDKSDIPPAPSLVPRYPRAVPTAIDPAIQAAAKAEIAAALRSNNELIRAHALETLAEQNITDQNPAIVDALRDRSSLVRKAAALASGQLRIMAAVDRLPELLDTESQASLELDPKAAVHARQERVAALFALHELGRTQHSHSLEASAADPSAGVRGDTAFVFGLIGDKSAIPWLSYMLHNDTDVNVRLQAAESLWRLGSEEGLDALITATISGYISDQMIAALALAQPRDTRVLGNIHGLLRSEYIEVRLVCTAPLECWATMSVMVSHCREPIRSTRAIARLRPWRSAISIAQMRKPLWESC